MLDVFLSDSYLEDMDEKTTKAAAAATWLRRIIVWTVVLALVIWAGCAIYRVFGPKEEIAPIVGPEASVLPRSTGEDPHAQARKMLNTSRQLLRSGDVATGLKGLEEIIASDPDSPQAKQAMLVLASSQRFMTREPQKAIETYTRFVERFPADPQVPQVIGYLRELAAETSTTDRTDSLLRSVLPQLESDPRALERVKKLIR